MGCLLSHSQDASAETLAAQANSVSRSRSNATAQADRPAAESDRAAIRSLWTANISPAELSLPRRAASSVNPEAAIGGLTELEINPIPLTAQNNQIDQTEQTSQPIGSQTIDPQTIDPQTIDSQPIDLQTIDPELGRLRLRDESSMESFTEEFTEESTKEFTGQSTEESTERFTEESTGQSTEESSADATADPELGRLRLRDRPLLRTPAAQQPPPAEPQTIFLLGSIDYFRSDNILADDIDPVDDQILTVGASLLAIPRLGPQTQLVASVGANLARYSDLTELNYSNIQLRLGIRQNLFPRTFGELSWTNQQFFSADDSRRFLNDHSLRLALWRRDPIAPRLNLDTFYQFRLSFTDPIDRSRFSNTLGAYLSYELQQNLEVGLDYQLSLTHFTQQEREDRYHQLTAQLSYDLSRESRISLYGGFSFGRSSDSSINFNSGILGVNLSASLALF